MNRSNHWFRRIYLPARFYQTGAIVALGWIASFFVPVLLTLTDILVWIWLVLVLVDLIFVVWWNNPPEAERTVVDRISNGEPTRVKVRVYNPGWFRIHVELIDELPDQFQRRDFSWKAMLKPDQALTMSYTVRPVQRGVYHWHDLLLYSASQLGLVQRRHIVPAAQEVHVYPSFVHLRKYSLQAKTAALLEPGTRQLRKIGHSMEFEQIKEYVRGDDVRTINWKATARRASLMVNQFTDERSQQVYLIIDQGRLMKMPFHELSLLDHAINAALVLAHVSLQRQDRVGLITFSKGIDTMLPADRKAVQMEHISQALFKQETNFQEPDFERLHAQIRARIRQRSLLVLFTNFESMTGLKRQLPYLRALARHHLLLVVFFENTELTARAAESAQNLEEVYIKTIAEKLVHEKRLIVRELMTHGILSLLTPPAQLTPTVINKYLELKARQAS